MHGRGDRPAKSRQDDAHPEGASESECPFVYCFVPRIASERDLAGLIAASLSWQLVVKFPPTLTTFAEAVAYLLEFSKARPMVLVVDECQDLEGIAPNFWSQLQKVWGLGKNGQNCCLS